MIKLAIALTKGGVGKTTTAVNLADGLARAGKTVLLMDVDTQGQAARMLNCQPRYGLAEVINGDTAVDNALHPARPGVWILAGGRSLAGLKRTIARKEFNAENTLSEALEDLGKDFDYVLLDTAPGWDTLTINVLFFADLILAPVSLEVLTLQGLLDFKRNLEAIQKYRPSLELKYILPTFYDRRVRKSGEIVEQLNAHFGAQVCEPIRYNVRLSEAPGYGQTIFEYAPNSTGAEDYRKLTERILAND
jgi:chromosome partitioning protein